MHRHTHTHTLTYTMYIPLYLLPTYLPTRRRSCAHTGRCSEQREIISNDHAAAATLSLWPKRPVETSAVQWRWRLSGESRPPRTKFLPFPAGGGGWSLARDENRVGPTWYNIIIIYIIWRRPTTTQLQCGRVWKTIRGFWTKKSFVILSRKLYIIIFCICFLSNNIIIVKNPYRRVRAWVWHAAFHGFHVFFRPTLLAHAYAFA